MKSSEDDSEQQATWDRRFLGLALSIGGWSKDRSRGVGAIIVGQDRSLLSVGYNGFPRGIDESIDERHLRPAKYLWTEHAERNAIYDAARRGVALQGATMYLPWYPCADCARAIIQSGIISLVALRQETRDPAWDEHFIASSEMLKESGIQLRLLDKSEVGQVLQGNSSLGAPR